MLVVFPEHQALTLWGMADDHGVSTHVDVTLAASDAGLLLQLARERSVYGTLFVDLPHDDDGEELVVPHVSVEALARMPVHAGLA